MSHCRLYAPMSSTKFASKECECVYSATNETVEIISSQVWAPHCHQYLHAHTAGSSCVSRLFGSMLLVSRDYYVCCKSKHASHSVARPHGYNLRRLRWATVGYSTSSHSHNKRHLEEDKKKMELGHSSWKQSVKAKISVELSNCKTSNMHYLSRDNRVYWVRHEGAHLNCW